MKTLLFDKIRNNPLMQGRAIKLATAAVKAAIRFMET